MNYAARNISNKLIWMTRQLRKINLASEIQEWLVAMRMLNDILVAVSDNDRLVVTNDSQSTWAPRYYPRKSSNISKSGGNGKDAERESQTKMESVLPNRLNRRVVRGMRPRWTKGMPINKINAGDHKTTKINSMEIDIEGLQGVEPSVTNVADVEIASGVGEKEMDGIVTEMNAPAELTVSDVKQLWKDELYRGLKVDGTKFGCHLNRRTRLWVTESDLWIRIAQAIHRDPLADFERKDFNLNNFLDDELNRYLKTGSYDDR